MSYYLIYAKRLNLLLKRQPDKLFKEYRTMFDKAYDVCEAYYLLEADYNVSGVLQERKSNLRRNMSTGFQLSRMKFTPRPNLTYATLTEQGKEIYDALEIEYGLVDESKQ